MKYENVAVGSEYSFKWSVCAEMVNVCSKSISCCSCSKSQRLNMINTSVFEQEVLQPEMIDNCANKR